MTTSLTYDALGRVIEKTDARGVHVKLQYDALGRLLREDFSDGTHHVYTYDQAGNRLSMTDPSGKYSWTYDSRNLVLSANCCAW